MNTVEISWPSGTKESFQNLPAEFIYTIEEGKGVQKKVPFAADSSRAVRRSPASRID